MKDRGVIAQAIVKGAATRDFFGTAYGQSDEQFEGFKLGDANIQFDGTLLLIEPEAANAYEITHPRVIPPGPTPPGPLPPGPSPGPTHPDPTPPGPTPTSTTKPRSFHGTADVNAATAKVSMVQLAEEIISILSADPNASVKVTVEIAAEFPQGASDQVKRAVSENARSLGLKGADWE